MKPNYYLAIDLGAESGRLILGKKEGDTIDLKEIHRFPNGFIEIQGKYHWNIARIYSEILIGLKKCATEEKVQPESIGIDTWGVDYGLLTADGTILGLPFAYRDPRTKTAIEEFTEIIPKRELYDMTGTLFAPYNTLFQLYAAKKYQPEMINAASDLLFIPDLLAYMLTGKKSTDLSFATTSQLYNPTTKQWEQKLFDALGVDSSIMQEIVEPGAIIAPLSDSICKETGMDKIPVVAVATHDTNSAIAATPSSGKNWAFISSGTWSLMGVETETAIINDHTFTNNFTNEGGVGSTFNVLRNHMGLWLLQQSRQSWGTSKYDYPTLVEMAEKADPFKAIIDIDDMSFLNPPDMPQAIKDYCKKTDQVIPEGVGQLSRVIMESIALKYADTAHLLNDISENPVENIIIIGGGINNQLLCQFTANACNIKVKTGLQEGSATGNLLTQALGLGHLSSLSDMRKVVDNSCKIENYDPQTDDNWKQAKEKYNQLLTIGN